MQNDVPFGSFREERHLTKIAPSILSADFCKLGEDIHSVESADLLHFDVMDGIFVPNISFGLPVLRAVRKCISMTLDVHLMIEKPIRYIEDFAASGADIISIHLEADHPTQIAAALKEMERCGVKKAIALRPIASAKAILPYIEELDMVLVMTVEPGFGGQSFMMAQVDTVAEVRQLLDKYNPSCDIEVDGGISEVTAANIKKAGANVLVAGSSIFGAENRAAAIQTLRII